MLSYKKCKDGKKNEWGESCILWEASWIVLRETIDFFRSATGVLFVPSVSLVLLFPLIVFLKPDIGGCGDLTYRYSVRFTPCAL